MSFYTFLNVYLMSIIFALYILFTEVRDQAKIHLCAEDGRRVYVFLDLRFNIDYYLLDLPQNFK